MTTEPPRIRDDRRDPDLTRLKERIAVVEKTTEKLEQLVQGMHYALFGLPEDRNNNGLVGEMHSIRENIASLSRTINRAAIAFLLTTVSAVAADILTRHT